MTEKGVITHCPISIKHLLSVRSLIEETGINQRITPIQKNYKYDKWYPKETYVLQDINKMSLLIQGSQRKTQLN